MSQGKAPAKLSHPSPSTKISGMPMQQKALPITPFTEPLRGYVNLPGSKSITNRALILGAISNQTITIRNALISRDTRIMSDCLRQLGFELESRETECWLSITGLSGSIPESRADLYVGNAGTAARFITALLSLKKGGKFSLDGDRAMRERPMYDLLEVLIRAGAANFEFHGQPGCFPFTMYSNGWKGGQWTVDASASSQILSALLMIMPVVEAPMELDLKGKVRRPYIEMTVRIMEQFGNAIDVAPDWSRFAFNTCLPSPYWLEVPEYRVEPDVSAASYFMVLPISAPGELSIHGLGRETLQGDAAFAAVVAHLGLQLRKHADRWHVAFASPHPDENSGLFTADFFPISDTFITLAAIVPLLHRPVRITGIGHTRRQETDRISAMTTELRRLGQTVREETDALEIHPNRKALIEAAAEHVSIQTYRDHRIAMGFAILGCHDVMGNGEPWLTIVDPDCTSKTFPEYFKVLESLRIRTQRL